MISPALTGPALSLADCNTCSTKPRTSMSTCTLTMNVGVGGSTLTFNCAELFYVKGAKQHKLVFHAIS